jgi:hypothetical protein
MITDEAKYHHMPNVALPPTNLKSINNKKSARRSEKIDASKYSDAPHT